MSKIIMLLVSMSVLCSLSFGHNQHQLKGVVVNENNEALPGASVFLHPLDEGTVTDSKGQFYFNGLHHGNYTIEVSFIGYQRFTEQITVQKNKTLIITLKPNVYKLKEVTVKDHYAETRKKDESLSLEIVNNNYLKQNLGGSLMNSLESLPGVTTIDIGSGQSKPVIRGLGFNRVVVVENNIKHEAQQWGSDHGLEIDQYAVNNVEVIKGPASLVYGSDAIGGVVNLRDRMVPAPNSYGGTVDVSGKSNNDFVGTSASLFGRKKWFFAKLRATILDYGDYKVPTDSINIYSYKAALHNNRLRNTAGNEQNLHLTLGVIKERFQSKLYASSINSKSGFFANTHGLEPRNVDKDLHDKSSRDIHFPYQEAKHFKITNNTQYRWDSTKMIINLGYQRNYRQEWSQYVPHGNMPATFPDSLPFSGDLEREFEKHVYSGNLKLEWSLTEQTDLHVGLNNEYQDNKIDGRGFIIPAFEQVNLGGFALTRHRFSGNSLITAGIRYDYGNIKTQEYFDWFAFPVETEESLTMEHLQRAPEIDRHLSNFSWSVGYNHNTERWIQKINLGKSFRMPIAKELAANGVNYHNFSYEIGNKDLSPEISYQLDAGITYKGEKFEMGTTPFLNYFSNYIYLNPTPDHNRQYGSGNQVFRYTQSEVLRYGGELHAEYQILASLQAKFMAEYVYSKQLSGEKEGFTLPFSPPPSGILSIKYQKQQISFIKEPYLSADLRITLPQNNIVPPEETTEGHQVINIKTGGQIWLGNQRLDISFQVQNILNTKHFNHTNYYRLINVPEPGRNFVLNISMPFSGKFN